jgi:hypothetical protein
LGVVLEGIVADRYMDVLLEPLTLYPVKKTFAAILSATRFPLMPSASLSHSQYRKECSCAGGKKHLICIPGISEAQDMLSTRRESGRFLVRAHNTKTSLFTRKQTN